MLQNQFALFLTSCFIVLYSEAQRPKSNYEFTSEALEIIEKHPDQGQLKPMFQLILDRKIDSVIASSIVPLNTEKKQDLKNFIRFFRGVAFKKKLLFRQAQEEFMGITEDFELYHFVLFYLGVTQLEQQSFSQSLASFQQLATSEADQLVNINMGKLYHNMGIGHLHLGQFDSAELFLQKSIVMQRNQADTVALIGSYGDLANVYYEQYQDDLAIPYFKKAYHLAQQSSSVKMKQNTSKNMAVVEENREDFAQALVYRKEYERWQDSLNDQNKIWEIAQLEKEFAVSQKEKEVKLLQSENRLKVAERNGILYAAVGLLLLLGIGSYFYREKVQTNRLITLQKEKLTELNDTKDQLFSIVSHDLRSSANALKKHQNNLLSIYQNGEDQPIEAMITQGSKLAHQTFNLVDNLFQWALLQTRQSYFHIEPLRLYFMVEQVAFNYEAILQSKGIGFQNHIPKNITILADQETFKIVIRNLMDNAIKYTEACGRVTCCAKVTEEAMCEIALEDTGIGMTSETISLILQEQQTRGKRTHIQGTGLGFQLCKDLIARNRGKLDIQSRKNHGTTVIIQLPIADQHG